MGFRITNGIITPIPISYAVPDLTGPRSWLTLLISVFIGGKHYPGLYFQIFFKEINWNGDDW